MILKDRHKTSALLHERIRHLTQAQADRLAEALTMGDERRVYPMVPLPQLVDDIRPIYAQCAAKGYNARKIRKIRKVCR